MKKITLYIIFIVCLFSTVKAKADTASINFYQEQTQSANLDSLLSEIQTKIHNAFYYDMSQRADKQLIEVTDQLKQLNNIRKNNLVTYWRSYAQFYLTIYYVQNQEKDQAKNAILKGVELMTDMNNKTSDDYALLSRLEGLSLQFIGPQAMNVSMTMMANAKLALKIDPNNIRANFVFGCNDFFTPKAFGGGGKAEKYLLKAISLPSQQIRSPYLPSWGKEEAYEYLIRHYIKHEQFDSAKKYAKEALTSFPNSYLIKQLSNSLNSNKK